MGHINYDVIEVGDTRAAATLNDILDDIETESTNLESMNVAEEGLDRGSLAASVQSELVVNLSASAAAGLAQVAWSAVPGTTSGGVTLAANDVLRIRGRLFLESTDGTAQGLPNGVTIETRLVYDLAGGGVVYVPISHSYRKHVGTANDATHHGTVQMLGVLAGSVGSLGSIRMEYQVTGGNARMKYVSVTAVRFKGVT